MEYQPLQTIYLEDLRGIIDTQIVVYQDDRFVKTDEINKGETSYDVPLNFSSESDEANVPISKRRLFECVLKGKRKETQTENVSKKRNLEKIVKATEQKKIKIKIDSGEKKGGKTVDVKENYEGAPLIQKRNQWS
ncbi:uncharacterized protein E5676_scaffold2047G00080 [Cucumis melo var. makuwa]|uniref:Uncharacterized protein n=1 Tax=Cucumis melo var. makuwa TaxID=1194695 RepID=A0A5A7T880_CUCMM|nr:uncharacterized protein E6C27_scaffold84G001870 [Cucumis melo var. makuwa]TYK14877.1 uncharacterized protein E5676_scaffold2047G00080 [Cucumis melo var. makuwa]